MKSLNIGIVAYGIDPSMVMVRVPNERGRWMLVDRSVVEVDCPWCGAVAGEPCRGYSPGDNFRRRHGAEPPYPPESIRYGVSVHVRRKQDAQAKHGGGRYAVRLPPHKLRLTTADLAALQADAPEHGDPQPEAPDIDVPVTRKEQK